MPATTLAELEQIRSDCRKLVSQRALISAAAAVVPIPGLDVSTDVALLLQILPQINEKFGLSPQQIEALSPELKKVLVVGGANFSIGLLGKVISPKRVITLLQSMGMKSLATKYGGKYIPIIGSVAASGLSYIILRRVGHKHIDECFQIASQLLAHRQTTGEIIDVEARVKPID